MIEYSILIIQNGGKPYYLKNYNTFESCFEALENMISLEKERGRLFFVDNDFYPNEFKFVGYENIKYFCIKSREVTEWKKINTNDYSNTKDKKNCKVINILNYF